jgi:glycerophosphoryl diester phosphodiesterase
MSSNPPRLPELIACRGNVAEFPENTLPALRSALELGARHVSVDVQLTADHVPVLLRDANLKRTAALDRNALEMTWRELAEVSVNESERLGDRYTDVCVPSLAQAASLIEGHPTTTLFVELKRSSLRQAGQELVVGRVLDVLKPIARQCVLTSSDLAAVHYVRQVSGLRIGWILSEYTTLSALKCEALCPDFVFCDQALLTDSVSRLWRGTWRWAIYEVNDRKQALDLAARDVRLVETTALREMMRHFRGLRSRG